MATGGPFKSSFCVVVKSRECLEQVSSERNRTEASKNRINLSSSSAKAPEKKTGGIW